MADEVGGVSVKLSVDARQFRAGMRDAKQDTDAFNESLNMAAKGTAQLKAGGGKSATKSSAAQNLGVDVSLNVTDTQLRSLRARVQNALRNIPVSVVPEVRGGGGGSALTGAAVAVAAQTGMTQQQATQTVSRTGSRVFNIPPQGQPWPARAMGGPVQAQRGYIVGELRPEVFVPKTPGIIEPSVQSFYRTQEQLRRKELQAIVADNMLQQQHDRRIATAMRGRGVRGYGGKLSAAPGSSSSYAEFLKRTGQEPDPGYAYHGTSRFESVRGTARPPRATASWHREDPKSAAMYEEEWGERWRRYNPGTGVHPLTFGKSYWAQPQGVDYRFGGGSYGGRYSRPQDYNESRSGLLRTRWDEDDPRWARSEGSGDSYRDLSFTGVTPRSRLQYWGEDEQWHSFRKGRTRNRPPLYKRLKKAWRGATADAYRATIGMAGPVRDPQDLIRLAGTPIPDQRGATVPTFGGAAPSRGYSVGIASQIGAETEFADIDDPVGFMRAFHKQRKLGSPYVGTWIPENDRKIWVDPVTVTSRKRWADMIARSGNELAYYDLGRGEEIPTSKKTLRANAERLRRIIGLRRLGGWAAGVDWRTQDWRRAAGPEVVPTAHLLNYRHINREAIAAPGKGKWYLDELTEKIDREGFDPTKPVALRYSPEHHVGLLGDGNHRLAAAIRLGLTELPTELYINQNYGLRRPRNWRSLPGSPITVPDEFGYVPRNLPPSWVGFNREHSPEVYQRFEALRGRMAGGLVHAQGGRVDITPIDPNLRKYFGLADPRQLQEGMEWYAKWGAELRGVAGELGLDPRVLTSATAALSPRNPWPGNFHDAVRFARASRAGQPMPKASGFPANRAKAWEILQQQSAGLLKGLKVNPFSEALLGDPNATPQDIWMKRAAMDDLTIPSGKGTPSIRQRREMDRVVAAIAGEQGLEPRQTQATIWTVARDMGLDLRKLKRHARLRMGGGPVHAAGGLMARMGGAAPAVAKRSLRLPGLAGEAFEAIAGKRYGWTDEPQKAGWLSPTGKYLDFSDGTSGRYLDHTDAQHLFPRGVGAFDAYEAMEERGWMRLAAFNPGWLGTEQMLPTTPAMIRRVTEDAKFMRVPEATMDFRNWSGAMKTLRGEGRRIPALMREMNQLIAGEPTPEQIAKMNEERLRLKGFAKGGFVLAETLKLSSKGRWADDPDAGFARYIEHGKVTEDQVTKFLSNPRHKFEHFFTIDPEERLAALYATSRLPNTVKLSEIPLNDGSNLFSSGAMFDMIGAHNHPVTDSNIDTVQRLGWHPVLPSGADLYTSALGAWRQGRVHAGKEQFRWDFEHPAPHMNPEKWWKKLNKEMGKRSWDQFGSYDEFLETSLLGVPPMSGTVSRSGLYIPSLDTLRGKGRAPGDYYDMFSEVLGRHGVRGKKMAGGGSGKLDGVYLVGEIGEELFVPNNLAHMIPKKVMDQIPRAMGGMQVIGKRRDHDLGGELFFPPTDGVIIPNRLMDQVPRAAEGVRTDIIAQKRSTETGRIMANVTLGKDIATGGGMPVQVMNWPNTLSQASATQPPGRPAAGSASLPPAVGGSIAGPLPPERPSSAGTADDGRFDRRFYQQARRAQRATGTLMQAYAVSPDKVRSASTATTPTAPASEEGQAFAAQLMSTFRQRETDLYAAGTATSTRTPQGLVAMIAAGLPGFGGSNAVQQARVREQRDAMRGLEKATTDVFNAPAPASGPAQGKAGVDTLRTYMALQDDLSLAREDEKGKIQEQIEAMEKATPELEKWNKASEHNAQVIQKSLPGLSEQAGGLIKVVAGIQLYSMAMQGLGFAMSAGRMAAADLVDQQRGWRSISIQTTTALADQTKAQAGNVEAVMNQQAASILLGGGLSDLGDEILRMPVAVQAGATAAKDMENYVKTLVGVGSQGGAPVGTYGGFSGPFFEGALLGRTGGTEALAGALSVLNPETYGGVRSELGLDQGRTFLDDPLAEIAEPLLDLGRDIPLLGDLLPERTKPFEADLTLLEDARKALVADLDAAAARAGKRFDTGNEVKFVADQQQADLVAAIEEIPKEVRDLAEAGIVVTLNGRTVETQAQSDVALPQAIAGLSIMPPETWAKEAARVMNVQFQAADIMGEFAQSTTIPYQFATGLVQNPLIDPAAGLSLQNVSSEAGARVQTLLDRTRADQTNMGLITRNQEGRFEFGEGSMGRQGMDAMRALIENEDFGFGSLDRQVAEIRKRSPGVSVEEATAMAPSTVFDESMQAAMGLAVEIANLTEEMQDAQKEVQDVSIANQFRLANRALADARGLVGDIGGSRLGYLQREQYLTGRASQALGLNAQRLSLASQEIGLAAQKLSLALQARQIATNLAVAQFQAPGETGEERFARQREAIIRAGIEKRQLGFSRQQFGISQQQFGISEQQVGLATKQFTIAGKIWAINARRAATDAERSLEILQVSNDARAKGVAAQKAMAEAARKQGQHLQRAAEVARRAENRKNQYTSALASGVTALSEDFIELGKGMRTALLIIQGGSATSSGGVAGSGTTVKSAAGFYGTVGRETQFTVGEAGAETVAVLRNPRKGMLNGGGGAGGSTVNISISDVKVRSGEDIEQLATMVANKVEQRLGRKGQMLGLRQPSY